MDKRYRSWMPLMALVPIVALAACDDTTAPQTEFYPRLDREECDLPQEFLLSVLDQDAIPSIDDPVFVDADDVFADYLAPEDRVIGLTVSGQAYAVPHNVLWHHEIVNFDSDIGPIAVTYCPLTGSSMAFNRADAENAEFGVSGFLFQNNLVMYDRRTPSSVWVQMQGNAACGPAEGTELSQWPVVEMRWSAWRALHPETVVLGQDQNMEIARDYSAVNYPYGDYEDYGNDEFLYPARMPELDRRRPVKERVLGVPAAGNDLPVAFPFDALTALEGRRQVVSFVHGGEESVVLWDDEVRGGMAYRARTLTREPVELAPAGDGFVDEATGSVFSVDGRGLSGPLADDELVPIRDAYVAFWGAWAAFQPDTELWEAGAS